MTMTLISTVSVGVGGAATIAFSSISQDATDLLLILSARTSATATSTDVNMLFNGLTTNFSTRHFTGNGTSGGQTDYTNLFGAIPGSTSTANTFSNSILYISNYANSNNKTFSIEIGTENNASVGIVGFVAGSWTNTSAITSIELSLASSNFVQNSTASLYKITKGSDGITVVT